MKNKGLELGRGPILPLLLKMSWPSIAAMFAMALYNLVDTFRLTRLNPQAVAALTICFPIQIIFGAIGVGTGVGAGSFAARMFGADSLVGPNLVWINMFIGLGKGLTSMLLLMMRDTVLLMTMLFFYLRSLD